MALAYSTHGSALYGNTDLKTDIIGALDWMYTNNVTWTTVFSGSSSKVDDAQIQVFDFSDVNAR